MKKILFSLAVLVAGGLCFAHAAFAQENITNFAAKITVNKNASIHVTESVSYDFGNTPRHGIYRDIPVSYKARGGNFSLRVSNILVTDQNSVPYQFTTSYSGGMLHLKIGNQNQTVTGSHLYLISYDVNRAINYFSDHDELYWNVTGNGWGAGISQAQATVILPDSVSKSDITIQCYAGSTGSTQGCQESGTSNGSAYFSQTSLGPNQGLTVVVGFPTNAVQKPSVWANAWEIIKDNGILALPIVALIFFFYLWYTRGRDPKGLSTVVAQYEAPDNLTPTEVGTIIDETVDNQDVSAEILDLAVKGYITITKIEKKVLLFRTTDYQLDLLKDTADLPNKFQKELVEGLFSGAKTVKLSDLENKFFAHMKIIKDDLYDSVVEKGYFVKNPKTVRNSYRVWAVLLLIAGIGLLIVTRQFYFLLAFAVTAILMFIFSFFMPVKTKKGADTRDEILGLKLFLSVTETERLKFFNAPEKNPKVFEKFLPYAMVLGVEKQWAKQFEGIYLQPPGWYNDRYGGAFNSLILIHSLNNFNRSVNTALISAPQPSGRSAWGGGSGFGGGFSGGGFGGGGGGSW